MWLRENIPSDKRSPLGLRDDAACLDFAGDGQLVVTTDLLSDGVDFRLAEIDPQRAGRKALAVNLSDLAAMAAKPIAAFVSIALPRHPPGDRTPLDLAIALYRGLIPLAKEFDITLAGGDTNSHDGPLVISVTAIGQSTARRPLTRSGGLPGDWLLVTGHLGGSLASHHLDFIPRVREALLLHDRYDLHAGMDISDGLALDASRLAAESGCGAIIRTDRLPVSSAAVHSNDSPEAAIRAALRDGEDFELLIAASPEVARAMIADRPLDCGLTHIGELASARGLWCRQGDEAPKPLEPEGWLH